MWAKLSHVLTPKRENNHEFGANSTANSPGDVMSSVFEQHPNVNIFHVPTTPRPPSGRGRSRMDSFTRRAKADDESTSVPSPITPQLSLGPWPLPLSPSAAKSGSTPSIFKVPSPDQSMVKYPSGANPPLKETSIQRSDNKTSSSLPCFAKALKSHMLRPSAMVIPSSSRSPEEKVALALHRSDTTASQPMSELSPSPALNFTGSFDTFQRFVMGVEDEATGNRVATSTPYCQNGKEKERELDAAAKENHPPIGVYEAIFPQPKAAHLPDALHDPSNWLSFKENTSYSALHDDSKTSSAPPLPFGEYSDHLSSAKAFLVSKPAKPSSALISPGSLSLHTPRLDINDSSSANLKEDVVFSLKARLALQIVLCRLFEKDLRARDELVEGLRNKLGELAKSESRKCMVLRQWKKKVAELEHACRFLREDAERSCQHIVERSIMDQVSEDAIRTLHTRVSVLERENDLLGEELGTIKVLFGEKSEDATKLKEMLWSRDESVRELKAWLTEAKEHRSAEERERYGAWEEERRELLDAVEHSKLENAGLVAELDNFKHVEVPGILKSELDPHKDEELEATEAENMQIKLENVIHELRDVQGPQNKKCEQLMTQLREQEHHADALKQTLKACEERIVVLGQVNRCALDNVARAQETARLHDADAAEARVQHEAEAEALRGQLRRMKREHASALEGVAAAADDQARLAREVADSLTDEIKRLRHQLTTQLHKQKHHADELKQTLKVHEERIVVLGQERQCALDDVARLQETVRGRDADAAEAKVRHEAEVEALREELNRMRLEHASALEDAATAVQSAAADKEDAKGVSIAPASERQDLELRRTGLRGKVSAAPVKNNGRASDRSTSSVKVPPVGNRTQLNGSTPRTVKFGTMGPPPIKKLGGPLVDTPRPKSQTIQDVARENPRLSRSASAKPATSCLAPVHRGVATRSTNVGTFPTRPCKDTPPQTRAV
ncbi:hypothetical protein B0H11DRAFT_2265470 [Mycena galericulata]|nr:hypothetical protein B0H11DRAFT_2265470 [Mycena galericulata]